MWLLASWLFMLSTLYLSLRIPPPLPNLIYPILQNTNRTGHFSPPLHLLLYQDQPASCHQPLSGPPYWPPYFIPSFTKVSFYTVLPSKSRWFWKHQEPSMEAKVFGQQSGRLKATSDQRENRLSQVKKTQWKLSQEMKVNKRLTAHISCCDTVRRQACHPDSRFL